MIPRLSELEPVAQTTRDYLQALRQAGFKGDIASEMADRVVGSTDNSVYQILPQALIYPRDARDVALAFEVGQREPFKALTFTARGGGTGTNGQSLSSGIIMDVGRHMNRILAIDLEAKTATVEPGVVLDQLNAEIAKAGLFFAPNLSPSSRATIGGMIATDASGQGSRVYGKTSEHILGLEVVLHEGSALKTQTLSGEALEAMARGSDAPSQVVREALAVVRESHADFVSKLPQLRRFLTGYNIARAYQPATESTPEAFDLRWLITGAEGTLGVVTQATVKLTPIPTAFALAILEFSSFKEALASAEAMVALNPSSIETIDDKVLNLARGDIIMNEIGQYLPNRGEGAPATAAINLVEFEGASQAEVDAKLAHLLEACRAHTGQEGWPHSFAHAQSNADRKALWQLRAKGVGLLGATQGRRKPVPFVEDTVVPPERLSAYVADFRAILDAEGLSYGMFGHVDVGCLHVRPALDLRDEADEARMRRISDKVAALCQRYGGVIWGEHGKGFRSEYSPMHFGELFPALERIKSAFDPHHRLNPGKVATPVGKRHELVKVEQPLRGHFDRQIDPKLQDQFTLAIDCNGNGQCFHWDPNHVMCPSSKVTRERIHTPKGRAGVMREWLRQMSRAGKPRLVGQEPSAFKQFLTTPIRVVNTAARGMGQYDYSNEVMRAMSGCLACKACATQCPVKVDVPSFRAEFVSAYHTRYLRPLRDHLVAGLEGALKWMSKAPWFFNAFLKRAWFQKLFGKMTGLIDTPVLPKKGLTPQLVAKGFGLHTPAELVALPKTEREVVLLQDAFTTFYEPHVVLSVAELLRELGYTVRLIRFFPNGKGLHIKGFLNRFERQVRKNHATLKTLAARGVPIVAVDPAVALTYRDEYRHLKGLDWDGIHVALLQEFLAGQAKVRTDWPKVKVPGAWKLLGHCTEKTLAPASQAQWAAIFKALGCELSPVATGCCGMSGVFGHEAVHAEESRGIFELSWEKALAVHGSQGVVATGYSCRSQVKRFQGEAIKHPAEVLLAQLRGVESA